MYKEIIDPNLLGKILSWRTNKILAAGRSNNFLDTTKLENMYPNVKNIKDSVRDILNE